MESAASHSSPYIVLIPVYNDWESLSLLLKKLDEALTGKELTAEIAVVDDGSANESAEFFSAPLRYKSITRLNILRLNRNMGHQQAIAVALAYLYDHREYQAVVVMDADGEDNPDDVPLLISEANASSFTRIIFAARKKRRERLLFRLFYALFKSIYKILTGIGLNFGNFSVIPRSITGRLVGVAELWNHYPASVLKARLPFSTIATERGSRFTGQSKMNFVSLIIHGLSALSVFGEVIGIRALIVTGLLALMSIVAILLVVWIKTFTSLAIPGWASYVVASFMVILLQSSTLTLFFIFIILHSRNYSYFIPRRDYKYFILNDEPVTIGNE